MEIDGSQKSGSGTILRLSVALAGILGEPLHIYNIRQKRSRPGLRHQHLEAVRTAAKICNAEIRGASLGSKELWFKPNGIRSGEIHVKIGTAGSISMLLLTILPICTQADDVLRIHVMEGGTDVLYSPTISYLKYVFLRMLKRMGLEASLTIRTYGYYPKGRGEVLLEVKPCKKLRSIVIEKFGTLESIQGISVCTFLEKQRVAERQACAAIRYLKEHGCEAEIQVVNDKSNTLQRGSSIALWAETSTGALLGGDNIGEIGKPSEIVGRIAAEKLFKEIEAQASVDIYLADMLVPYIALAEGRSVYLTRTITEHLSTNIWLTEKILKTSFRIKKVEGLCRIEKSGL